MMILKNRKLDVVIPIYNGKKYLPNMIKSLEKQTFQDFNLFLIDDFSDDGTYEYLRSYKGSLSDKIILFRNEKNLGPGPTRNVALDQGLVSEYVMFIDVDDYLEDYFFEKMVITADNYSVDMVICGIERETDNGSVLCQEMINNEETVIYNLAECETLAYMIPVLWNKLFRSCCIGNVRFQPAARSEDTVFIFELLPQIGSIKFINEVLYHYVVRNNTMTTNFTEEMFDTMLEAFSHLSKVYKSNDIYNPYYELLVTQAFIRCAIGGTYRLAFCNLSKSKYYENKSIEFFNNFFYGWRNNKYLSLSGFTRRNIKKNSISVCALLYKLHIFKLFIFIYWIVNKLLKKEVRF